MNFAKLSVIVLAVTLFVGLSASGALAADTAKTVSGKASCGHCSGVVDGGCCVLLTDNDGARWVLTGDDVALKTAFKARKSGKTMTATLSGEAVTKKGKDGKDYKEVKVSHVTVGS